MEADTEIRKQHQRDAILRDRMRKAFDMAYDTDAALIVRRNPFFPVSTATPSPSNPWTTPSSCLCPTTAPTGRTMPVKPTESFAESWTTRTCDRSPTPSAISSG